MSNGLGAKEVPFAKAPFICFLIKLDVVNYNVLGYDPKDALDLMEYYLGTELVMEAHKFHL